MGASPPAISRPGPSTLRLGLQQVSQDVADSVVLAQQRQQAPAVAPVEEQPRLQTADQAHRLDVVTRLDPAVLEVVLDQRAVLVAEDALAACPPLVRPVRVAARSRPPVPGAAVFEPPVPGPPHRRHVLGIPRWSLGASWSAEQSVLPGVDTVDAPDRSLGHGQHRHHQAQEEGRSIRARGAESLRAKKLVAEGLSSPYVAQVGAAEVVQRKLGVG